MIGPGSALTMASKITPGFINRFTYSAGIVVRKQTGKLLSSAEKTIHMEMEVAVHLGKLTRDFESGAINEDNVENGDETHFCINLDNGRTLGFIGDEHVKYADVVSGGIGMTMILRITGGKNAYIRPPFMIFQNSNCSYPMRNLPDNIPCVSYRTGPRGWMYRRFMAEMLAERRAIRLLITNVVVSCFLTMVAATTRPENRLLIWRRLSQ
jgi:hypothetical protein